MNGPNCLRRWTTRNAAGVERSWAAERREVTSESSRLSSVSGGYDNVTARRLKGFVYGSLMRLRKDIRERNERFGFGGMDLMVC